MLVMPLWQWGRYSIIMLVVGSISLLVGLGVLRKKHVPGARFASVVIFAGSFWAIGYALELANTEFATQVLLDKIQFAGVAVATVSWFLCVLSYTGRIRTFGTQYIVFLSILPIAMIVLSFTNELHHLVWIDAYQQSLTSGVFLEQEYGIAVYLFFVYQFAMIVLSVIIIVQVGFKPGLFYYRQGYMLLTGLSLPFVVSVIAIAGLNPFYPFEPLCLSFNLAGLVLVATLTLYRRGDIISISRPSIVDSVDDAMIVCDVSNTVVDANKAFVGLIEKRLEEILGDPLDSICPLVVPYLEETIREKKNEILIIESNSVNRHFDVRINKVVDKRRRLLFNIILLRDISERIESNKKIEEYAAALERSNTDLKRFANIASHDLQEPLRMISSYLGLLEKRYGQKLDETADEYIEFATEGAKRMQIMIQSLLDYSSLIPQNDAFERVDIDEVLQSAIDNLRTKIEDHRAQVEWDPMPIIEGNSSLLVQLFQNLIDNAVKYHGREAPKVHITVHRRDDFWEFGVTDNGIGLEKEHSERIFEFFNRLHTAEEYPGMGVGLSVSKRIVEGHKGRIWVDSKPEVGSTFYFTLPVDQLTA